MTNEATLIYETAPAIPFICDNSTGIERGAGLTLTDPMTAATVSTSQLACAGIASEEKIASDGKTKLPVYREGIFKVTASGAITVGEAVGFTNSGKVVAAGLNQEFVAGTSLETAADGETFLMELRPDHRNLA